jgi:pimeloyl-ACP methyl ester carboxylesterase
MMADGLLQYCATGASAREERVPVTSDITLRIVIFNPPHPTSNLPVLFVAGWITMLDAWKNTLREMTRDFQVYYVETREKISSTSGKRDDYSVTSIGRDLVALVKHFGFSDGGYQMFGSSLGATAILDCCRFLTARPHTLILIAPNAVFRVPLIWKIIVGAFYPPLYAVIRPAVKWYLRTFRLNIKADYEQYAKYCRALDAADPWKLKPGVLALAQYEIWPLLKDIDIPTLLVGASKDSLHEPENLRAMAGMLPHATIIDLETNTNTHSEIVVTHLRQFVTDHTVR